MRADNPASDSSGQNNRADPGGVKPSQGIAPFRESGSGKSYSPSGNWGAERQASASPDAAIERALGEVAGTEGASGIGGPASGNTMAGSPTDAGDGGFGPEGGYSADADNPARGTDRVDGEIGGVGTDKP